MSLTGTRPKLFPYLLHPSFSGPPPATFSMMAYPELRGTTLFQLFDFVVNIDNVQNILLTFFFSNDSGKNNWHEKYRWNVPAFGLRNVFHLWTWKKTTSPFSLLSFQSVCLQGFWARRRLQVLFKNSSVLLTQSNA